MNSNTISIWSPTNQNKTCSFLYREEHANDFKNYLKSNNLIPRSIFTISPNAYHIEDLCLDYAAELKQQERITKSRIAHKISAINGALKIGESGLAERLLDQLSKEWHPIETALSNFLNIKKNIVANLLTPMYWEPPFNLTQSFDPHKQWWRLIPDRKQLIEDIRKEINLKLPGKGASFAAYIDWIETHENKLNLMKAQTKAERHLALNEASAYFMAIAENHLQANRPSLSILLLHRAADLLLMRACDELNLISFTGKKPEFYSTPKNCKSKEIHFRSSHEALKQNGLNHDPAREKIFSQLNNIRNHLMYTHYLSAPDRRSANEVYKKTKPHLIAIGGKKWNNALQSYQPIPELSVKALFESNPVLTSAITEISLNEILT